MFHHTHTSIENAGKGKLRQTLKNLNILTMRQSKDLNKKKLRTYLHHTSLRLVGDNQFCFNELNIPFFHGTEV